MPPNKNDENDIKTPDSPQTLSQHYHSYLTQLASTLAHELRTPLASIQLGSSGLIDFLPILFSTYETAKQHGLVTEPIAPHIYPLLKRVLSTVRNDVQYSLHIIDMILLNLKSQHHTLAPQPLSWFSIKHSLQAAINCYPFYDSYEKELILYQPCNNDFFCLANEQLLTYVFFNLIKNAIYYIKAASKGKIYIWLSHHQDCNQLHFKDTGNGMTEMVRNHLFKEFFSTQPHGTGTGLMFCKTIMAFFGGTIECFSEEGKFTEFILSFPK